MVYLKRYILNVLIGIEQLIMALCGGDPDETWSSLSWRIYLNNGIIWPYRFIDWLFYKGHCQESYEKDEGQYALWAIYKQPEQIKKSRQVKDQRDRTLHKRGGSVECRSEFIRLVALIKDIF